MHAMFCSHVNPVQLLPLCAACHFAPLCSTMRRCVSTSRQGLAPESLAGCMPPVQDLWHFVGLIPLWMRAQVYSHGGDVMRFAGDSAICAFLATAEETGCEDGGLAAATQRAVRCAAVIAYDLGASRARTSTGRTGWLGVESAASHVPAQEHGVTQDCVPGGGFKPVCNR